MVYIWLYAAFDIAHFAEHSNGIKVYNIALNELFQLHSKCGQYQKPGMKSIENEGVKVKTDHCRVGAMPKKIKNWKLTEN